MEELHVSSEDFFFFYTPVQYLVLLMGVHVHSAFEAFSLFTRSLSVMFPQRLTRSGTSLWTLGPALGLPLLRPSPLPAVLPSVL